MIESEFDELNLKIMYRNLLNESVSFTVLSRCGFDKSELTNENEFENLYHFNTPETMIQLGEANSDFSSMILREIEKSVKRIDKELRVERSKTDDHIQTGREIHDTRAFGKRTGIETAGQAGNDEKNASREESQSFGFIFLQ